MQSNLATKIPAKWESGLTTVRLKRHPPVVYLWVIYCDSVMSPIFGFYWSSPMMG